MKELQGFYPQVTDTAVFIDLIQQFGENKSAIGAELARQSEAGVAHDAWEEVGGKKTQKVYVCL